MTSSDDMASCSRCIWNSDIFTSCKIKIKVIGYFFIHIVMICLYTINVSLYTINVTKIVIEYKILKKQDSCHCCDEVNVKRPLFILIGNIALESRHCEILCSISASLCLINVSV